jgi:hypothetical protein
MFSEALQLNLDLAIEDDLFRIPGGSIKNCQVHLYSYGFDGKADFWISSDISKDKLFSRFTRPDQIEARLSIQGVYNLPLPRPEPLVVKGPVTWKSVREVDFEEVKGHPVLFRHYAIHFQDPARVLWSQHFPTALNVNAKMEDVIKAQVVEDISLTMDWDALEKQRPMICLGQGAAGNAASFYDFLMWYVTSENGVFTYDSHEQTYSLSGKKNAQGPKVSLLPQEVEEVLVHLPETCRHSVKVLNAYSETPRSEDITQDQAVSGTRRDVLLRTSIASQFDGRRSLEAHRLKNREHEIELVLKEFPAKTFRTGSVVTLDKRTWSKHVFPHTKKYRVYEIHLNARAKTQAPVQELDTEFAAYNAEMTARLELEDHPRAYLPAFETPHYPIHVEGKIVSEFGKETDKTYQIYSDSQTSQDFYTVHVPLWNQEIKILFEPYFLTGHFYFPAFKHSRVLLALYFDRAEIDRFLAWGAGARLPMDTQGNHILLGKNEESQTSIQHVYRDDKPVFSIQRILGADSELIELKEGTLILETKEDESKKER